MAVYAIGDVQGSFHELLSLLELMAFDPSRDRLWFCGDLVNRGPRSAEVLRFVRALGERAVTVLGNHDLHLLAVAAGTQGLRRKDTIQDILASPDRDELLQWLRHRPLLYHDETLGFTLVHAGLPPQWSLTEAKRCAREVEATLQGPEYTAFLESMYGNQPNTWSENLTGWDRLRFITNCLTRIRYCDRNGRLSLKEKGPPGTQDPTFIPWFEVPRRKTSGQPIIFGHWATLRLHRDPDPAHHVHHLDTGCAWGGRLTAMRLEDRCHFSVPCRGAATRD